MRSQLLPAMMLGSLVACCALVLGANTDAAVDGKQGRLLVHRTETITALTSTVTTKLYSCISGIATGALACTRRRRRRLARSAPEDQQEYQQEPLDASPPPVSPTVLDSSLSEPEPGQGRFLYTVMKKVTTTITTTDTVLNSSVTVAFEIQCTVRGANLINLPNCPI